MYTIFSTCRPLTDERDRLNQTNAVAAWRELSPEAEIILFGDEEGVAGLARRLDCRWVPDVERAFSLPLVGPLFAAAERLANNEHLCYRNADIISLGFGGALEAVARQSSGGAFLMTGARHDLDLDEPLDFGREWQRELRGLAEEEGKPHAPSGRDWFAWPKGTLNFRLPPLVVGRDCWDTWWVQYVRHCGVPIVDATRDVFTVHLNHEKPERDAASRLNLEGTRTKYEDVPAPVREEFDDGP